MKPGLLPSTDDAVDPELFPSIEGSADSEVMFYLALTLGLHDAPPSAVERMVGLIESTGRANGIVYPMQMTVATSDGNRVWAFRYSSVGRSIRSPCRAGHPESPMPCS